MNERLARIEEKVQRLAQVRDRLAPDAFASFDTDFNLSFAHHSTAIEGNTLSLLETKVVYEDQIAVGGKSLREIYEVANHRTATEYVNRCLAEGLVLDEDVTKEIHALLTANILVGGIYRNEPVRISGAGFKPPAGQAMYDQVKAFFSDLPEQSKRLDAVSFAAWTHAEFVRIHPFIDGNGRTARFLMNYQLRAKGLLPVVIEKDDRLRYYEALEAYAVKGDLAPFSGMIAELEEERLDDYLTLDS